MNIRHKTHLYQYPMDLILLHRCYSQDMHIHPDLRIQHKDLQYIQPFMSAIILFNTSIMRHSYLTSAIMTSIEVPAVSVCLASTATLRTFIDIPASHPGYMGSKPGVTRTGETSSIVGAGGLNTTVGGSIEI